MAYIAGGDTDDTKLNYKPAISDTHIAGNSDGAK